MSTSVKRNLFSAQLDAGEFKNLFEGCYDRWEVAGSVRRLRDEVGDVEHVVIPRFEMQSDAGSFFGEEIKVNLLWQRAEKLLGECIFRRHLYPNNTTRWGEKYRGIDFKGFAHEIFCADALNWGSVLAIRTGPADYSQMLVTRMLTKGQLRQQDGYVRYVSSGDVFGVPEEADFFAACGVPYAAPPVRGHSSNAIGATSARTGVR